MLSRNQRIFLTLISLLGYELVFVTASTYGLGVSNDSLHLLSAADNFAQGNGLTKFDGDPLILWAPLYPFLVGLISKLTGFELLSVGLFINALAWGVSIYLAGILFRRTFPNNPIWFYIGSTLMLLSVSALSLAVNFATDVLFLAEFHLFLILAQRYLTDGERKTLYGMGALTAVSMFTRYNGIIFAISGAILVIYHYRADLRKALRRLVEFAFIAGVPFLVWVALRNYPLSGTLVGSREFTAVDIIGNFVYSYERMLRWFVPLFISVRVPVTALLAGAIVGILVFSFIKKRNLFKSISTPILLPIVVVPGIYFAFILATTITRDHIFFYDDRYQVPLDVLLLILVFSMVQQFLPESPQNSQNRKTQMLIVMIFLVWSTYPIWLEYKFIRSSMEQGVVHYNMFNTKKYRESNFIEHMSVYDFGPGVKIFSNEAGIVYYYTRQPVHAPFYEDGAGFENIPSSQYLLENHEEWFAGEEAYLIWMLPNQKSFYYPRVMLTLVYDLEPVFTTKDGVVYLLLSR